MAPASSAKIDAQSVTDIAREFSDRPAAKVAGRGRFLRSPQIARGSHPHRIRLLSLLPLLTLLLTGPACLAVDSASADLMGDLAHGPAEVAGLRDHLRAAVRPVFELSLLLLLGLTAVVTVALRCRRTERARIRNLRQLRLLSSFENEFPARLSAELRGVLARINGRSELMLDPTDKGRNESSARGLQIEAATLRLIMQACAKLEDAGPALKNGRRTAVDLGRLVERLSGRPIAAGSVAAADRKNVRTDPELLELALTLLLRTAAPALIDHGEGGSDEGDGKASGDERGKTAAISIHAPRTASPDGAPGSPPAEPVLLAIHSNTDYTQPGLDAAGLALGERILLSLGGRLRITTEHGQGSTIEVELPS